MAIGVYFGVTGLSAATYDECIKQLRKAGAAHPKGRTYHVSFGPADAIMVFDVWTSQAAFDKFGKTMMPIVQGLGGQPASPNIMPIHKVIVPAPKVAPRRKTAVKAVAKKAGAKKAAAPGRRR